MRKGNVKIFVLMLFILAGIAFIFFFTLNSNSQAQKTALNSEQEKGMLLTQMQNREKTPAEKQAFNQKLDEYRRMATNLDQRDMTRFKTQSKDAFLSMAALIDNLKGEEENGESTGAAADETTGSQMQEAEDDENGTDAIRTSAGNLPGIEDENELVNELKNAFNSSREALEEVEAEETGAMDTEEEAEDKYEQRFKELEQKINGLNLQNYKSGTKELLLNFHSMIKQMSDEMYRAARPMEKAQ